MARTIMAAESILSLKSIPDNFFLGHVFSLSLSTNRRVDKFAHVDPRLIARRLLYPHRAASSVSRLGHAAHANGYRLVARSHAFRFPASGQSS